MYQLRAPAPDLLPFIEHYWFVTSKPEKPVELQVDVFVDARADLIINLGAPYLREVIGGETREVGYSNLDAQRLLPIRIIQRGMVATSGVRFHLGGLGAFSNVPLRGITNATVPPAEVFGAGADALEELLSKATDVDAQAALFDAFFLERLKRATSFETFQKALQAAVESNGTATVEDMAQAAGITGRQVDRLCARYLGIAPKTLSRVVRFQTALKALMRDPGCTLAEVAANAGYFDQAHFIKDFRQMTGGVPRGYRGYYPPEGPNDFAPNVVVFLQDRKRARE
ncbi:MAG: AraC family transcriptional regulator [Polyangiaceae bacterium]|nr:AraC family transcriptional regulator [Polyangiaceae bacterium]